MVETMKKAQKRGIVALVIILAIITVFMAVKSFATDSKFLNIVGEREGSETYRIPTAGEAGKTIWKIVSFDSMKETDKAKYDEAIYCINPERGFGSERTTGNDRKEYNFSFNMKDLTSLEQKYKDMFADQTKYNSMLWILDNCYLPKQTPEADRKSAKATLLASAEISRDVLTDNDIEVVQQMALWYFSSEQEGYHYEPENFPSIELNNKVMTEVGQPESTIGKQRYNDMKKLYEYFITSAKANSGSYGTGNKREVNIPKIAFTTPKNNDTVTSLETISEVEYFVAGPYKITDTNHAGLTYTLTGKVLDQSDKEITGFKLLDSEKKVDESLKLDKTILGKEFYIAIATTNKSATKIKLNITTEYITTSTTCWTHNENYATEQPVVILEKKPHKDAVDVEVKVKRPEFDLALRKFISAVNGEELSVSREPVVSNVDKLAKGTTTTATYTHPKDPVPVKTGDLVTYTIRIYNEGEMSGYAAEITDDVPEGLKFVVSNPTNIEYMWKLSKDEKSITTTYLSLEKDEKNLIPAFDATKMTTPAYKDIKIVFEVIEPNTSTRILRNIAQISQDTDEDGNDVEDRDSTPASLKPEDLTPDKYKPEELADNSTYVEDDDDYDRLKLEYFDLSLRKFITKINSKNITSRIPKVDVSKLVDGTSTTATYTHTKEPLGVQTGDTVTYTIRIYNEGQIDGTATEITDTIPNGLKFIPATKSSVNKQYGWELSKDGKTVTTKYLEKNIIKAFDKEKKELDFKDVLIEFEVTEPNTSERILRNIAEITDDTGDDIDSKPDSSIDHADKYEFRPDNSTYEEDDDDYEQLKLQYFDLSLRKFITKVNSDKVTTRIPVVSLDKDGKLTYKHPKDPVLVANNDVVTYTIRVYNEGKIAGYASEITDDIPKGLAFLPEHETNKEYDWKLSEDGKSISTDYLSKTKSDKRGEDNLLTPFDKAKGVTKGNPDYRDILVAFKVTETNLATDRIIINTAEITDDRDEFDNEVKDEDSIPNNNKEDEDDIDKEYLRVKYFDLALLKWVSKTYVTENGKTTVTDTGHTGLENPEPIVKVDLDRKNIKNVTVKFGYTIKITNEGEIEGYAKEISDYIPAGLKFVQADNPDWKEKDGKIVTDKLANTLLKPGESATVEVILTWINDGDNVGVKINVAEISKDYNKHGSKDIDSIPDNKKEKEDDIDDAPVMLAIRTGDGPTYIILGIVVFAMLFTGIGLIKKYVLC